MYSLAFSHSPTCGDSWREGAELPGALSGKGSVERLLDRQRLVLEQGWRYQNRGKSRSQPRCSGQELNKLSMVLLCFPCWSLLGQAIQRSKNIRKTQVIHQSSYYRGEHCEHETDPSPNTKKKIYQWEASVDYPKALRDLEKAMPAIPILPISR